MSESRYKQAVTDVNRMTDTEMERLMVIPLDLSPAALRREAYAAGRLAGLREAAVALEPLANLPIGPEITEDTGLVLYKNAGRCLTVGDALRAREKRAAILALAGETT